MPKKRKNSILLDYDTGLIISELESYLDGLWEVKRERFGKNIYLLSRTNHDILNLKQIKDILKITNAYNLEIESYNNKVRIKLLVE